MREQNCEAARARAHVGAALAEKGVKVANAGGLKDWTDVGLPVRKIEDKKPQLQQ